MSGRDTTAEEGTKQGTIDIDYAMRMLAQVVAPDPDAWWLAKFVTNHATDEELVAWASSRDESQIHLVLYKRASACQECGSNDALCKAHDVAISEGGTHHPDNLLTLCKSCCSSKGSRTLDDWRRWIATK